MSSLIFECSEEGLDRQIAMGDEALAKFKTSGVADMGTICQTEENGKRTGMFAVMGGHNLAFCSTY